MNKVFAEHVTSTAFFLSISKKQMEYLAFLRRFPYGCEDQNRFGGYYHQLRDNVIGKDTWIASMRSIANKGLVVWIIHDSERQHGHYEITKAGELVCDLLEEAGLIQSKEISANVA